MGTTSDLLRLHFFRDLSAEQRVQALIEVGLLTDDWTSDLTHTLEWRLFDRALRLPLDNADLALQRRHRPLTAPSPIQRPGIYPSPMNT